ncbi:hypothetical protein EDC94DRAFT_592517 [Helicostylum pulchrum]|nr:hypothetical protein EDC94DRAFT_592517 [Helicostylum pulchrum]
MYACICSKNHKPSRVENFGVPSISLGCNFSDPYVPPSTQQHFKVRNNSTVAINPQDIILDKNRRVSYHPNAADYQMEDYLFKNMIDPTGCYNETEQPFYSSFSDTLFNDSPSSDLMFSVGCPEETFSSSSSISSIPTRRSSSTTDSIVPEEELISLPPSAAILQSELNRSSLDYFIANNSFIEEIRSSISLEQQQYINSGMARMTPSHTGVTNPSTTVKEKAYDLISSTDYTNLYFHQTAYDDIFENEESRDKYYNPSNTDCTSNENKDGTEIKEHSVDEGDEYYCSKEYENRVTALLQRLNVFIYENKDHDSSTFQEIKREYRDEINDVFKYKDLLSDTQILKENSEQSRKLGKLYTSISNAYGRINLKINNTKGMNEEEKNCVTERLTPNKRIRYSSQEKIEKKSRKNYGPDVVNVLMDWYLDNDGSTPSNKEKQVLAERTGKSSTQISTWFQNAKRRYQDKLNLYQSLSSKHPKTVYDTRSLKAYLGKNKHY